MAIAALSVLIGIWVAVDVRSRVQRLLAVVPSDARARGKVVLVHALVELGLFGVAVGLALVLVTVPAGTIGALGFFPLLRGLAGLTSVRFVPPRSEPVLLDGGGSLALRTIARAASTGGIDRLALFVPGMALATGGEMIAAGVALLALLVIVAVGATWWPRASPSLGSQRLLAWLQLLVGIVVLLASGMFNWVVAARG